MDPRHGNEEATSRGNSPSDYLLMKKKIRKQLQKIPNFKSPGPDGIPNFWLKQLDALHNHYARIFNELIQEEKAVDEWLGEGKTFLIPKSEETQLPHKYRPITDRKQWSLPTTYKLLPRIITEMMYHHRTQQGGVEA